MFRWILMSIPAIIIAYLLAPYATLESARITYRSDVAAMDVKAIRIWAQTTLELDPDISFSAYDKSDLWEQLGHDRDPWDNQYQTVELNRPGLLGSHSTFHVYSMGSDGISKTKGNDLDDINSWSYDRNDYYGPSIANAQRLQILWRTVFISPFIYLLLAYCFGLGGKSPRSRVPKELEFTES